MSCENCEINRSSLYILDGKMYDICISCFFRMICGCNITVKMVETAKFITEEKYFAMNQIISEYEELLDFMEFIICRFYEDTV
jgi:hypothetical protein